MNKNNPLRLAPHPHDNALYLHVPFCRSKCRYCDFYSLPGVDRETVAALVAAELEGLAWFAEELRLESLDTVYVGGGTPSLLDRGLLAKLLHRIAGLGKPREWTVEANPESLDAEFLAIAAGAGVSRLSLGVQSFNDRLLRLLGRPGDAAASRAALETIAARWTGDLSLDLITGLPAQTRAEALADIDEALAWRPDHLSVYTLTLEEGTPLAEAVASGECPPPSADREASLWGEICGRLAGAGYRRYEVSNFARPLKECHHNLVYWRLDPYIGIGPGAASTLKGAAGEVFRLETSRRFHEYLSADPERYLTRELIAPHALLLEHLLMGLRLAEGIERTRITRRFGVGLEEALGGLWGEWRERGLVRDSAERYACTERGGLLLNVLLREAAERIESLSELSANWP